MEAALEVLARFKDAAKRRFLCVMNKPIPVPTLPADAQKAFILGFQAGRQDGYGVGLVDGVELGLSVGSTTEELHNRIMPEVSHPQWLT